MRVTSVLPLLAALSLGAAVRAQESEHTDTGPAEAVVLELHKALIETAGSEGLTREQHYAALEPVIATTHDLAYIAELTIRRQWRDLSSDQKAAFVGAFERLSVMTYAVRFASVGEGSFRIDGTEDAGGGRVQVHAAIVRPQDDDVSMDYILHKRDGRWRIVNILADRVSDLALKRAQYQRVFADGGTLEDVIAGIEAETERL